MDDPTESNNITPVEHTEVASARYYKEITQELEREAEALQEQPATLAAESLAFKVEPNSYALDQLSNQHDIGTYVQGSLF